MVDRAGLLGRLSGAIGGLGTSFGNGQPFGATSPFSTNNPFGGMSAFAAEVPFGSGQAFGTAQPFGQGQPFSGNQPFGNSQAFGASQPFGNSQPFGGNAPFGGGNPFGSLAGPQPTTATADTSAVDTGGGGAAGTASTGLKPDVAKWATQAQQAFTDLGGDMPDVMLAIMTNESGGRPDAYNGASAGGAWGLFQIMGLGAQSPDAQFAAAHKLAQEKLAEISKSYARNGLTPDARTRARDFALAWAGHFDYASGQPNPNSRDEGSQQTAQQLADIFLANYDAIKKGRAAAPVTTPGTTGKGMNSIWGGGNAAVSQGFEVVDGSIDQSIYAYGADFGVYGHTGLDIGLKRGSKLYAPMAGTVVTAGGTPYYRDEDYGDNGTPGKGELRIQLDNGWILILGHTSSINVRQGQRVNPGDLVGLSGSANGDHLHLELRIPDKSLPSGYRIVNPADYLK